MKESMSRPRNDLDDMVDALKIKHNKTGERSGCEGDDDLDNDMPDLLGPDIEDDLDQRQAQREQDQIELEFERDEDVMPELADDAGSDEEEGREHRRAGTGHDIRPQAHWCNE